VALNAGGCSAELRRARGEARLGGLGRGAAAPRGGRFGRFIKAASAIAAELKEREEKRDAKREAENLVIQEQQQNEAKMLENCPLKVFFFLLADFCAAIMMLLAALALVELPPIRWASPLVAAAMLAAVLAGSRGRLGDSGRHARTAAPCPGALGHVFRQCAVFPGLLPHPIPAAAVIIALSESGKRWAWGYFLACGPAVSEACGRRRPGSSIRCSPEHAIGPLCGCAGTVCPWKAGLLATAAAVETLYLPSLAVTVTLST
jgi:hypothetical protein